LEQAGLDAAVTAAGAIARFRSLLVAKDGRLVLERYFGGTSSPTLFDVRSVTKSVVSLLTGIAIERGHLPGLDTPIGSYLTDEVDLDDLDRTITIRHLLSMTSGIDWDETSGPSYVGVSWWGAGEWGLRN
jgi:CubicO group peptidase (beta-lactamase class C family)